MNNIFSNIWFCKDKSDILDPDVTFVNFWDTLSDVNLYTLVVYFFLLKKR
jgi:hypothetical protein